MPRTVFETTTIVLEHAIDVEDNGSAKILEVDNVDDPADGNSLFVRIQSYDYEANHPVMDSLVGKRVRVTIEVLD
jgi:hypothetical protein